MSLTSFVLFARFLYFGTHSTSVSLAHRSFATSCLIRSYLHIRNNNHTSYHTTPRIIKKNTPKQYNIISNQKIMPKVATNRKGKSGDETPPSPCHRCRIPCKTVAAEMPVVTLVVTPEAASHARVSTSSSIETSPPTLSSQMSSQSSNLTNAFYAESSACIKKATLSVIKKKAENINFCDSAQVKSECLKYTKTAAEVPIDQQTQIYSFLGSLTQALLHLCFIC